MFDMKKLYIRFLKKDPVYYYVFSIAFMLVLNTGFGFLGSYPFKYILFVPCVLFLGAMFSQSMTVSAKKALYLPLIMLVWFVFLQIKRQFDNFEISSFASLFCVYFFAYPFASLIGDGEKKQYLKMFFFSLMIASLCLCMNGVLLIMNCLPSVFSEYVFWQGPRLYVFWHPNLTACFIMLGIIGTMAFFQDVTCKKKKLVLLCFFLLQFICVILTNCRTILFITCVLCAGNVFFSIIKGRWKIVLPVLVVAGILLFIVSNQIFEVHNERMIKKQIDIEQQIQENNAAEQFSSELRIDSETGEVFLKDQGQSSFLHDLKHLNARTDIWNAAFFAISESRAIQLFGIDNPGRYLSYYTSFNVAHAHNSWIECLLGMGMPGFLIALMFTISALWNCIFILMKYHQDVWKRNTVFLTLALMGASFMEPYLFLPPGDSHIFNFIFFLNIGYLLCWYAGEKNSFNANELCKQILNKEYSDQKNCVENNW